MRYMPLLFLLCGVLTLISCSSYFSNVEHLKTSIETLAQNSRVVLLVSKDDRLKIVARLTYLNEIDSGLYHDREYFFLEIFNDDDNVVLPDSMQITLLNKKPLWMRPIQADELDESLVLENKLSSGYLIAFRKVSPFDQKNMKLELSITDFPTSIFDFSYATLQTKL